MEWLRNGKEVDERYVDLALHMLRYMYKSQHPSFRIYLRIAELLSTTTDSTRCSLRNRTCHQQSSAGRQLLDTT